MLKLISLALLVLALFCTPIYANPIIPFTKSVHLTKESAPIKIEKIRGKLVLLMFFQSWCPKCNSWSAELFSQMESKFKDNKDVVLIALKTDGGGLASATKYLTDRGVNLQNWIIGTDHKAEYYKKVCGKTGLFEIVTIDGLGNFIAKEKAGSYYTVKGRKEFAITRLKLSPDHHLKTFLPADFEIPEKLKRAASYAELGLYKNAELEANRFKKGKTAESAKLLKEKIYSTIKEQLAEYQKNLNDKSNEDRYPNFQNIRSLSKDLKGSKIHGDIMQVYKELKKDPYIKTELKAEKAYVRFNFNLSKMKPNMRAKSNAKFKKTFLKRHGDTYYGRLLSKK